MKKERKTIWDLYARVYDNIFLRLLPWWRMVEITLKKLDLEEGSRILDAGCGTGNFLLAFLRNQKNMQAVGVDFSPAMLNRCKNKLKEADNVFLLPADLNCPLPFSDEDFDGVICINVLYAVKKPQSFLKEINRVLKREGKLLLVTPISQPAMRPVFKEHVQLVRKKMSFFWPFYVIAQILWLAPSLFLFVYINLKILKKCDYSFFEEGDLRKLVDLSGFNIENLERVYGGQNWFLLGKKRTC